jgi:hypothetical protein
VPVHDDGVFGFRADYGRTIRAHARPVRPDAGRDDHPSAMSISLDNANSTKNARPENLGRELLELHRRPWNYTEDDVKASARILTGKVAMWTTWATSQSGGRTDRPGQVWGSATRTPTPTAARSSRPT